jgi:hypothetical protein
MRGGCRTDGRDSGNGGLYRLAIEHSSGQGRSSGVGFATDSRGRPSRAQWIFLATAAIAAVATEFRRHDRRFASGGQRTLPINQIQHHVRTEDNRFDLPTRAMRLVDLEDVRIGAAVRRTLGSHRPAVSRTGKRNLSMSQSQFPCRSGTSVHLHADERPFQAIIAN